MRRATTSDVEQLAEQYLEQAVTAASENRLAEAREHYRSALGLEPANRQAAEGLARVDSLLGQRRDTRMRHEMLSEARRLVEQDSLLAARDILVRARQLGNDPQVDSLNNEIENRITGSEQRLRLRDLPQLVIAGQSEPVINVRRSEYLVSGSANDDDGISRIVLELNGIASEIYRSRSSDKPEILRNFEQVIKLSPGENRLKLTVFDGRNNNSAIEKRLLYTPPLWENPLFRYIVILGIVLSVAVYYYHKRNSFHLLFNKLRRRPFSLISPNPYIVGNPIRSREMFFGREDDFRFVKNKVDNEKYGSLIVLFGERRAGKTSVLYQIRGGRLGPSYIPVFLDMQAMAINNDNEFLGRVAEIDLPTSWGRGSEKRRPLEGFRGPFGRNPYPLFEKFIDPGTGFDRRGQAAAPGGRVRVDRGQGGRR